LGIGRGFGEADIEWQIQLGQLANLEEAELTLLL
jgi:hypothetical protein